MEPTGFPADGEKLGKWLGVAHEIGQAMTYYVLKQNGQIVAGNEEMNDSQEKKDQEQFIGLMDEILAPFDNHLLSSPHVFTTDKDGCNEIEDMVEPLMTTPNEMETMDRQNKEVQGSLIRPRYFNRCRSLSHGDRNEIAKVIKWKRDNDGNFIGWKQNNPALDSCIFIVKFPDRDQHDIGYNILAESLYSEMDSEGKQFRLF